MLARWVLLVLLGSLGCGVSPDPEIADQFYERLEPRDRGWARVPCRDRAAKVERVRPLVAPALDLRARLREFGTPPPPQLLERIMALPMLGWADDYRCVVQDFTRIDRKTEPDFEDARSLVAELYLLKGAHLLDHGEPDAGWAHVLDALRLYREPVAPGMARHIELAEVLRMVGRLIDAHPPGPDTLAALVEAVDATAVSVPVACAGLRHDLLTLAVLNLRAHFGQREREAVARRYGLDFAMRTWRTPQKPGTLDWPNWTLLREIYDQAVPGCTTRPLGRTLQQAAEAIIRLEMLHPPTGFLLQVIASRPTAVGLLTDVRISLLARLRGRLLRHTLGRDPTTAELALSFGRRPQNHWDGRFYTFVVEGTMVTVIRGPYQHVVSLDPRVEQGSGTSYPRLPKAAH